MNVDFVQKHGGITMAEQTKKKMHYAWLVLLGLCGVQLFIVTFYFSTASLYLPYITRDLGITTTSLAVYLTIHGLVMAFFTPIVARNVSKWNVRLLLTVGNAALGGIILLMSTFNAVWHWYIAAVFTGICAGCVQILVPMLTINNWFVKKVGFANGLFWGASGLGGVIFSPVVSSWISTMGWRTSYSIAGIIAIVTSFVIVFPLVRFKPADKGLLPYGAEEAADNARPESYAFGPTEKEVMKTVIFPLTLIVVALITLAGSFLSLLPTFAASINMLALSGLLLSFYQIGNTVGKFMLPSLVDKFRIAKTITIGCLAGISASVLLIMTSIYHSSMMVLAGGALLGIAAGSMSLFPMIVRSNYGTKDYGKLYSYHQITQTLVGCLAITAYSLIIEVFGPVASPVVIIVSLTFAIAFVFFAAAGSKKKFNLNA
jgi:MFS family permease